MNIFSLVAEIISSIVGGAALVFSVWVYCNQKKSNAIKNLAQQVMAYNAEEEEAVKLISQLNGEKERTVLIDLKNRAEKNAKSNGVRPTMVASKAKTYI